LLLLQLHQSFEPVAGAGALEVERPAPVCRHEVHVLAVTLDVVLDEGAERQRRQPPLTGIVEGEGDQPAGQLS
jgi:hypothetical protein